MPMSAGMIQRFVYVQIVVTAYIVGYTLSRLHFWSTKHTQFETLALRATSCSLTSCILLLFDDVRETQAGNWLFPAKELPFGTFLSSRKLNDDDQLLSTTCKNLSGAI